MGITLFLLITVPWFAVCEARNPGFLRYFFIHENLLRYITPEYGDRYGGGHAYPYGSALVMMLVGALPWSLAVFALLTKRGRRALISRDALVSPIEGMALTGALLIPLFWCFAKQLLATYMMPAVPLYCLWLAHSTSRAKTVSPVVYRTATAMLLVFVVGGVLAAYKLGQDKSTRQILNRLASQPGVTVNDPIVFVHSVPNSAYFYRPDAVVPHPKEPSETSLKRALSTPRGAMICARRHYQELAPAVRAGLTVVDQAGKWYIVKVAATELVPVKDTP